MRSKHLFEFCKGSHYLDIHMTSLPRSVYTFKTFFEYSTDALASSSVRSSIPYSDFMYNVYNFLNVSEISFPKYFSARGKSIATLLEYPSPFIARTACMACFDAIKQ